uniref:Uncharacterized protein n=1 Tax=Glossina pallidipes TaxID=7398 RepID=A0A1B0A0T0_GLOPL
MDPTNIPDSGESKIEESQSDELSVEDLENYCADHSRSAKNIKTILDNYEKSPNEQECLQEEHEQLAIPTDQCLSSDHDVAAGYETLLVITKHVESLIEEIQEQAMKNKHLNDLQKKYEDLFNQKISLIVSKDIKCNEEENFNTNTVLTTAYDEVGKFKANPEKNVEQIDGEHDKCLQPEKNGFGEQLGESNLLKSQPEEQVKQKLLELDENYCELEAEYIEEKKILEKEKEELTIQKQFSGISFSEDDENLYPQKSELKQQLNEERNQEIEEINLFQVLCLLAQERDELKEQLSDLSEENDLKAHDLEAKLSGTAEEIRLVAQEREELKEKLSVLTEKNDLMAHDLEAKLSETTDELHLVAQERDELKEKLSVLSEKIDLMEHDLEAKLSETTDELRLVAQEREELKQKLSELSEENDLKAHDLEAKLSETTGELHLVAQEREELKQKLSELSEENDLKAHDLEAKLSETTEELHLVAQERDELKQKLCDLNEENENLHDRNNYLNCTQQNEETLLRNKINIINDNLQQVQSKLTQNVKELEQYRNLKESEVKSLKQNIANLSANMNTLSKHDLEAKLSETTEELLLVTQERDELKQKLCDLREESDLKAHDLKAKLSETTEKFRLVAQERDELKQKLRDLSEENDLKTHDLEAKLSKTTEEFRLVAQERDELEQKLYDLSEENDLKAHDLEAKLSETTEKFHLVAQERNELKQKLRDLSEENDLKAHDLEAKLSETTEEFRLVAQERDELKQKLCDLSEENEKLHDRNNYLQGYNCKQQNEETLLRNKISLISDNLQQVQSKLDENVKELEQYRNLKESEVKSLNQNIANLSANMITLGMEKGSLQSQKSELKDQLRDIIVKFNFMSEECQKLEDYKCKQEKEQDVLKQQIQTLREEKEKLREYPHQLENLNHQHSTLKQKLKELEEKSLEETSMLKERFKSLQQEKYATEKKFFKRLQNEQDRHRKQLKVCNQKYCYQMMKAERSIAAAMQFIKMHSKAAEWSAPVTEIIKFLETKAMQIVKPDDLINMQTDRDFNAHLQRLEKKCNELKTVCHLHYKEREEKERKTNFIKVENSDYDSEDQNVSKADQIRSLKEQCKALDKELKFVKTKYQITRVAMKNAH